MGDVTKDVFAEIQDKIAALIPKQKIELILEAIPPEEDDFPDEKDLKK